MAYLDTPHTDAGNHTYLGDAHGFQIDNSFMSPLKRKDNLTIQMRSKSGLSIGTPRARQPLVDRRNLQQGQAEFTPLLKSAIKGTHVKKVRMASQTPSFAQSGTESPLSRTINGSEYDAESQRSITDPTNDGIAIPPVPSSSLQSTPLAAPPKEGHGIVVEQGNKLTLKEQENILCKIEKENFGLKLKIHFFEKMLQSADSGFDEAAVKENMDLKVDKVTLQRELARTRKTLVVAEREIETFRIQIKNQQEHTERGLSDEQLHRELDRQRQKVQALEQESEKLQADLGSAEEQRHAILKLEEDIENLEAEIRERDRTIDSKEDETDDLKEQISQHLSSITDLEDSLETTKQQLKESQEVQSNLNDQVMVARKQCEATLLGKHKAEEALRDIQVQLADKSFHMKDCSQKAEERINQLQKELNSQIEENSTLRKTCVQQSRDIANMEMQARDLRQEAKARGHDRREYSTSERERELAIDAQSILEAQLRKALEDNEKQSEARDLLQDRHRALTDDLEQLRQETLKYKARLVDAEKNVSRRQKLMVESENLRDGTKKELNSVKTELHELGKQLQDAKRDLSTGREKWQAERRGLELEKDDFQNRASGLQNMLDKLQSPKGSSTSQEVKLREALVAEEQRFKGEESALNSHIKTLQADLDENRIALAKFGLELADANERLRLSEQSRESCKHKIQGLEDEIEVLQCSLEECDEARRNLQVATHGVRIQQESDIALQTSVAQLKKELASTRQEKSALVDRLAQAQSQLDMYNKTCKSDRESSVSSELELRAEVIKLQRKMMEADENMSRLCIESREREAACQRNLQAYAVASEKDLANSEQCRKQIGLDLSAAYEQLHEVTGNKNICEETCGKLRTKIKDLEKSVSRARTAKLDDFTVAEERKDLHELLRKAKLEAEDLQTKLQEREADLQRTTLEGESFRRRLDYTQADQTKQKNQITALLSELQALQRRHEVSIESLGKKQREWEEERKTLVSRIQLSKTSVSNNQAVENSVSRSNQAKRLEANQKHAAEIRGLAKQIQWMKARCSREECFRAGLVFEKRFLLLQVDMFNACNALDLRLLERIGVVPKKKAGKTKPTLKIVAIAISASLRMQRLQRHWAGQRKIQASLAKKMVQMKRLKTVGD